jgi:hypothetical protein
VALPRISLIAALAACALATVATPARADALPQPYATWMAGAKVPAPRGALTLHLAECPARPGWMAACAFVRTGDVYLGREARYRDRFFHELGHLFDASSMSDRLRARFAAAIRRPGEWHWTATSRNPPIEQFAEAYSMCARHGAIREVAYGMYDYAPSPAGLQQACAIIRQAAASP